MKSRIGRAIAPTMRRRAARMPIGTPTAVAITAATRTTARVCIACVHSSIESTSKKARAVNAASPQPLASAAQMVKIAMTTSVGSPVNAPETQSTRCEVTVVMASNSQPKWSSSQLIASSTQLPTLSLGMGRRPVRAGQGGEERRARHDPEQAAIAVDHREGHRVAAHQRAQLDERLVGARGEVLVAEAVAGGSGGAARGGVRQAVIAGDADDAPLIIEHVDAVGLLAS